MKIKMIILSLFLSILFSRTSVDSETIRNIRLENFKDNYIDKTIQFLDPNGLSVKGKLIDVSSKSFIILIGSDKLNFDHSGIDHVYIMPKRAEFLLASNLALVGGAVSYLTLIVLRRNVDFQQKSSFTCLGFLLGGLLGKNTFYKPLKIDISGEAYD